MTKRVHSAPLGVVRRVIDGPKHDILDEDEASARTLHPLPAVGVIRIRDCYIAACGCPSVVNLTACVIADRHTAMFAACRALDTAVLPRIASRAALMWLYAALAILSRVCPG